MSEVNEVYMHLGHGGMCCGGMRVAPAGRPSARRKLNVAQAFGYEWRRERN